MGSTSERTFLLSLLDLDDGAPPEETIEVALLALMTLTRARWGRAEIHIFGEPLPMVRVERTAPSALREIASSELTSDVFETGFVTARLELRSRRSGVALTFRERALFDRMLKAISRLARRASTTCSPARSLHEATRDLHARLVANALQRARGNVARAARELGVTRAFVYKYMRIAAGRHA